MDHLPVAHCVATARRLFGQRNNSVGSTGHGGNSVVSRKNDESLFDAAEVVVGGGIHGAESGTIG